MGAGRLGRTVELLRQRSKARLAVICGSNEGLYRELEERYGDELILLHTTSDMDLWIHACDAFFTKPGGLSSTEAAVAGVPLVHLPPIPGCETVNARYFSQRGMSYLFDEGELDDLLARLSDPEQRRAMAESQSRGVNPRSAEEICDLAHRLVEGA